ncbi:MAG: ComF family protein [bacterium]
MVKKLLKIIYFFICKILEILFPLNCIVCGKLQPWNEKCICRQCWESYVNDPEIVNFQKRLSLPVIQKKLRKFPETDFVRVFCLGPYDFPLNDLVKNFKYNGFKNLAEIFAEQLYQLIKNQIPQCKILYIPMIPKQQRDRGYNQTFLIARNLASALSMDLVKGGIKFKYKHKPQVDCSYSQRINQMKNTMALSGDWEQITGKNVLVVDDVFTTGATLSEAYRVVKSGGANQIYAAVVAVAV